MTPVISPVQRAIEAVTLPGILIEHRPIRDGDEAQLWPEERAAFANSVTKVQRASGAARIAARSLMKRLGHPEAAIPKGEGGMPLWPRALVGSLAHDATTAIAALALRRNFLGLGIDIEPAAPLTDDLMDIVATPGERPAMAGDLVRGRVLFAVKEAVYKAVYPIDRSFLDHQDVEADLAAGIAVVSSGRSVRFRVGVTSHIVVLAVVATEAVEGRPT